MDLLDDAQALRPELTELRVGLHREPEVGLDLPRTRDRVLAALVGLPLEISTGTATTSVTAVLRGTAPAPERAAGSASTPEPAAPTPAAAPERTTVLLRGDMDALPLDERSGEDFAATNGAMHACGHDLHTTALVGAARLLCAHRDRLAGDVVFMFQPGEEGYDGAGVMLREGVLDAAGRRPDHAYALHVMPHALPAGVVAGRPGPMMSASYELDVTVRGAGGHGAWPHRARDPIVAAAEMVGALQVAVTRTFDVFDPVILTVGVLRAGTARNIIPDTAYFEATVRAFSPELEDQLRETLSRCVRGVAAAHGVEVDVELQAQYPVTVNDAAEVEYASGVVREVLGEASYLPIPNPVNASEDFSRVLQAVPGALFMMGSCPPELDPTRVPGNHSPLARFDSAVLPTAAALLAELAVRRLGA
ncbi:MAG TPA: M20 family metallopeptidase [Pseudonocardia sp.]|jgi:hippurate hydrolase|nr:M20 family metallopeptidase [Pseudonocardia sp.]